MELLNIFKEINEMSKYHQILAYSAMAITTGFVLTVGAYFVSEFKKYKKLDEDKMKKGEIENKKELEDILK